ncbi:MAG: hypothetical protein KBD12_01280 [Candidatus Pacebacteria bacterium]|nr:hypothetical protein [Candidatus Paceibacterota bacterium]
MSDEKKSASIPGGVVAIVIMLIMFVPSIWDAMASIFGALGSVIGSIANALNLQSQKSPGLVIILLIVAIVYFKKKKKD